MALRLQSSPSTGLRVEEFVSFAREIAEQEWQSAELSQQADSLNLSYIDWLRTHFPHVVSKPFSNRHLGLWEWLDALRAGLRPAPRIEVWPRGGAKSSTAELGTVYVGVKLQRRFVLYVSGTQELADYHVQSVASLFERIGIERAVGKHGNSKGWRRNQLRTATGFNVAAIGLDVATRGIKLDEFRPDLIIFDDIDAQDDSPKTIEKKISAITSAILPAGSSDCAVLFVQNLIHEESIVRQILQNRAGFLYDREVGSFEKAANNLEVALERGPDGASIYKVVSGEPTWAGQDLATIQHQINTWGWPAFRREAQHEVEGIDGYFFDVTKFERIPSMPAKAVRYCRAWDLAATAGGGDFTVGVLMALLKNGRLVVVDVVRGQWSSDVVRQKLLECAKTDPAGTVIRLPQDPGQAGKDQAEQLKNLLRGYPVKVVPVTGKKAVRARTYAERVNSGNVDIIEAEWNHPFLVEHRQFREDEDHERDDQIDPSADAANELIPRTKPTSKPKAVGSRPAVTTFKPI